MDVPPLAVLETVLLDASEPITKRIRALFYLRTIGTVEAIPIIIRAFNDPSLLLQHEICYVLGQINHKNSLEFLLSVLQNPEVAVISRHEAAEAIGAIGDFDSLYILQKYANDSCRVLAETCQLALDRLKWLSTGEIIGPNFCYSIDPAPPYTGSLSVASLREKYHDQSLSLFDRYRALFSLRDFCTDESVLELASGLNNPSFSILFQHEIAFVLGQMQEKAAVALPLLSAALENLSNHYIVRHEAAEAIGSITNNDEYLELLRKYLNDPEEPVRSSCFIALDISEYWFSSS